MPNIYRLKFLLLISLTSFKIIKLQFRIMILKSWMKINVKQLLINVLKPPEPGQNLLDRAALFRSHFSSFLSTLGRTFQTFCPLKAPFSSFCSFQVTNFHMFALGGPLK